MSLVNKDTIKNLILVPALITLAITLLRLTGELMKMKRNDYPARKGVLPGVGRVLGFSFLGIAVYAGLFALAYKLFPTNVWLLSVIGVAAATAGLFIMRKAWPSLFTTLFAYELAARIPVIIVMLIAIMNNWGTHYDVSPPNFPEMAPLAKWVAIGLFPQLTFWMIFTVGIGTICGGIAVAVMKGSPALAKAAS